MTIKTRCTTTRTVDIIKEWELNEKPLHVEAIRSTPFGRFIDIPPMRIKKCLLEKILSIWNPQRESFVVKGRKLRFTASDVAIIFSLSARGKPVDLESKSPTSVFYHQYFTSQNEKYPTASAIKKVMKALVAKDDEKSVKDFARLFILHLFATFLFCTSNYACLFGLVDIVNDLDSIGEYAWAQAIHLDVVKAIKRSSRNIVKVGGSDATDGKGYFSDCVIALTVSSISLYIP
ncbi:hypothetical protein QJS10_CPA06g01055 [Acorus calamus]|uniref:Aminotransferase-like plant mobile domain-containing protein n=1 Tax=Acorus calamus TaxID=4465 RepID=A0AAV9ELD5_ACOCL|nr:hypothetical protein QJS10_CPA06g01055 [Acorus calamus]